MTKYSHIYFKTLHTKAGVQVYLFLRPPKKKPSVFHPLIYVSFPLLQGVYLQICLTVMLYVDTT